MPQNNPCKPYFDSILLFCLLKELKGLEGKKIKAVKRDEENNISVCFADEMLFMSTNPVLYRVHLTSGTPPKKTGKHFFEEQVKFLRVAEVKQLGFDRIFYLGLSKSGIRPSSYLVFELIGPSSNVFLINEKSAIIASHRISKTRGKGELYQLNGKTFEELTHSSAEGKLIDIIAKIPLRETIRQQFKKMPLWLAEMMKAMDENELRKKLKSFLKQPKPYIHYEGPIPCFISPLRISSQSKLRASFSTAIAELYQHILQESTRERIRREILKKIRNAKKIQVKLLNDQEQADLSGEFKKKGELILLHIKEIKKGTQILTVVDPYDEKTSIAIEFDPAKTASKNAADYFRRARKAEKSKETIKRRTLETSDEIKRLTKLIDSIDDLPPESLHQMLESLHPTKRGKEKEESKPFRAFKTRSGRKILVGKSKKENEHLTFHVAKPRDLFFHVREAPGSHTILVNDGNITRADIQEAAEIAAHFSKAKHSSIVPVSYTQRRYVRTSKKLGTGKVIISHEKTIFVEPTPPPRKKENT